MNFPQEFVSFRVIPRRPRFNHEIREIRDLPIQQFNDSTSIAAQSLSRGSRFSRSFVWFVTFLICIFPFRVLSVFSG
jgi:hypothetical protein